MKLTIEVEVQTYGEDDFEVLKQIEAAILLVCALPELSVGTFVKTAVESTDDRRITQ